MRFSPSKMLLPYEAYGDSFIIHKFPNVKRYRHVIDILNLKNDVLSLANLPKIVPRLLRERHLT